MFPPSPWFTENDVTDQAGKVFIVTGATSGVGKEVAQILYSRNAKVYVAGRSKDKGSKVIQQIKSNLPKSKGELIFLHLDLGDLTTIKKSAEEFLSKEDKLDVLWNNAGVMMPPQGSKTKQGYELQLGTNNVAPFLFTKLLTPILTQTAQTAPLGSVRVIWVSSLAVELASPKGGLDMNNLDYKKDKSSSTKYAISKAGNVLHSQQYSRLHKEDRIVSLSLNPGNLITELQRHISSPAKWLGHRISYTPIHGAYTELYAGLSPEISMDQSGGWVIPWGRLADIRKDVAEAAKSKEEGGSGIAEKFWAWSEEQVKLYL